MLGRLWLFITVLLVLVSLALHQVALFMVALLFFLSGGIARLWDKYSLRRVFYTRTLSSARVFFGETVDLTLDVSNRKPLPLPWLQIDDEIPADLKLLKGKTDVSHLPMNVVLNNLFSLSWYHRVKRHYPLECRQRGHYSFGPATLRTGDIFGFFVHQQEISQRDHLIVYPRIVPLARLHAPSNQPMGEIRIKSYLFQDPLLTQGVREYIYGDSLKRIHWKSTARRGELQTRIFEATTTVDMAIFLDVRTVNEPHWGSNPDKLELAIITAVAVANEALAHGYRVGLYVNQYRHGTGNLIRLAPSQNPGQFRQILETLATVREIEALPLARFIAGESRLLPWGSSLMVISAAPSAELCAALIKMKRAGRKISLTRVGGEKTPQSHAGLKEYYVPDTRPWQEIAAVELYEI